jgi:hypothetical protein
MFSEDQVSPWDESQDEITMLMLAVSSYPARAALNPDISFAQHLTSVLAMGESYLAPSGYVN